jgi:hypothetical protein
LQQTQTPVGAERATDGAQHGFVARLRGYIAPRQLAFVQPGFLGVCGQAVAHDGGHIAVQQASRQQFAHQKAHAACRVKVVHVGLAVGVHAGQQRHGGRQLGKVCPVDVDASGPCHGHQVQRVVGAATRGQQAHHAVDDGLFSHHVGQGDGGPLWLPSTSPVLSTARRTASVVSAVRRGVPGLMNDDPGRCRPMISISIWLLLAVP